MSEKSIAERLDEGIKALLKQRRLSTGGWAPVTEEDLEQLHEVAAAVLEAKWGRDPDGDLPIEIRILDRTRERLPPFFPIPYIDEDSPDVAKQARRALDLTLTNLSMATDAMKQYLSLARLASDPETESMSDVLDEALPIIPVPIGDGPIAKAMQVFIDWHRDEITDDEGAADYGRRLIAQLAEAGVVLALK